MLSLKAARVSMCFACARVTAVSAKCTSYHAQPGGRVRVEGMRPYP